MNKLTNAITTILFGLTSWAAPLEKANVASDAQWMAHLDLEDLTDSAIGKFLLDQLREEIAKNNDSPVSVDVDLVAEELHSLTAYGSSITDEPDKNSVLIVKTGKRARSIIDGYIATLELETDGKSGVKRLDGKAHDTYLIGNELYATFLQDDVWVSSKSYEQIEKAQRVMEGRADNIESGGSELMRADEPGFFFLATVEGFDAIGDMPPQARILQKAKGGLIALGEEGDMVKTKLALSTPGPEVSSQLSRIVQGMVALASFAEVGDESLNTLMSSLVVKEEERLVSIGLEYPVESLISILTTLAKEGQRAKRIHEAVVEE